MFQKHASSRKISDDIEQVTNTFRGPAAAFGSKESFKAVKESLQIRMRALRQSKAPLTSKSDTNGDSPAKKKGMPKGWGENFVRSLTGAGVPIRKRGE